MLRQGESVDLVQPTEVRHGNWFAITNATEQSWKDITNPCNEWGAALCVLDILIQSH